MKLQTTKKAIRNKFNRVISIGYCGAQYLLNYKTSFAYSAGSNGWACDYYQIGNVCISTGYSPIGEKVDYKKLCELEAKAEKIVHNYEIGGEAQKTALEALLSELIAL